MLRNLRHFFHAQVKEIVERHNEPGYRLLQRLEVVGFILYPIRYALVIHMFLNNTTYYRYDVFGGLAQYNSDLFNLYFFILLIALHALALVGKKVFFFTHVHTLSFQIIYDICVRHTEIYWRHQKCPDEIRKIVDQCAREKMRVFATSYPTLISFIPDALFTKGCQWWAQVEVWSQLDHVDKKGFMREQMPLFPTASFQTRAQMILCLVVLDSCIYALMILCFTLSVVGITYYSIVLLPHYPWWQIIIFVIDFIHFAYLAISFTQCGVLFTLMATYCSVLYICHFNELYHIFTNIRARVRLNQLLNRLIPPTVRYLIQQHSTIVYYIVYTNKDVWGNALLLFVLISIPVNAYMVSLILMDSMTNMEIFIFLFIIIVHAHLGAIPMVSVAYTIQANYRFRKCIIPVQTGLGRNQLATKLKLEDIFGRMSRGHKYGLTIGPMSSCTFTYLFELVLSYVAVFIFVLDKKREFSNPSSS